MTDDTRPILFLDFDGVLNSFGKSPWPETYQCRRDDKGPALVPMGENRGYLITTSKHIGAALLELPVEIRWLTTWRGLANPILSELVGLPDDLVQAYEPDGSIEYTTWRFRHPKFSEWDYPWKLHSILHSAETEGRPIIWIDDEAINDDAVELIHNIHVTFGFPPIAYVRTDHMTGLLPEQIEALHEWVASL